VIRLWCPRCGQGWVRRVMLEVGLRFWVCDECEGVWKGMDVGPFPDVDLPTMLSSIGESGGWSLLKDSDEVFGPRK
jgi:ribosomal protein L37AE/L43A